MATFRQFSWIFYIIALVLCITGQQTIAWLFGPGIIYKDNFPYYCQSRSLGLGSGIGCNCSTPLAPTLSGCYYLSLVVNSSFTTGGLTTTALLFVGEILLLALLIMALVLAFSKVYRPTLPRSCLIVGIVSSILVMGGAIIYVPLTSKDAGDAGYKIGYSFALALCGGILTLIICITDYIVGRRYEYYNQGGAYYNQYGYNNSYNNGYY